MSEAVLFTVPEPGIALLTINRPDSRNALSKDVREGLFAAWGRFENDPDLRVAILTGAGGKAFCAGGDLKEMAQVKLEVPPRMMFPVPGDDRGGQWRSLCGRLAYRAGLRSVCCVRNRAFCHYRS